MAKYRVRPGQSLSDIAIEVYGSAEGVFALLEDNVNLAQSLDAIPAAGEEILIREANPVSAQASFLKQQLKKDGASIGSAPAAQSAPSDYVSTGYVIPGYVE